MGSETKNHRTASGNSSLRRLAVAMACIGLLAACSSDSGTAASSSRASTSETSASAQDSGLEQARAEVTKFSAAPTSIGVTGPLTKSPRGKRVDYLQQDVPIMKLIGDQLQEAATILGIEVNRINAGSTPESWGRAFDQAVQDAPDAVLAGPIPAAVVGTQLKQLAAKNIPVVVWTSADLPQAGNGITVNFDGLELYKRQGELMADWVAIDSGGKANVAFFNIPDFPSLAPLKEAFSSRLSAACPDCSMSSVDVGATAIATDLPGRVVSQIQQSPQTKYVVMAFGDMAIGVPEALAGAGVGGDVKLVSQSGGFLNYQYVKSGQQAVDVAIPFGLYSWKLADMVARLVTGDSVQPDQAELMPTQFLTKDQITFDLNQPWPGVEGFQDKFKTLWAAA